MTLRRNAASVTSPGRQTRDAIPITSPSPNGAPLPHFPVSLPHSGHRSLPTGYPQNPHNPLRNRHHLFASNPIHTTITNPPHTARFPSICGQRTPKGNTHRSSYHSAAALLQSSIPASNRVTLLRPLSNAIRQQRYCTARNGNPKARILVAKTCGNGEPKSGKTATFGEGFPAVPIM